MPGTSKLTPSFAAHVPSILLTTALINMAAAVLMLGSLRDGRDPLIAHWVSYIAGFAMVSIGFALRGVVPDVLVIAGANAVALVTLGLPWLALRRLRGLPAPAWLLALAPALWLGACLVPESSGSLPARVCLRTALTVTLLLGGGREALRASASGTCAARATSAWSSSPGSC